MEEIAKHTNGDPSSEKLKAYPITEKTKGLLQRARAKLRRTAPELFEVFGLLLVVLGTCLLAAALAGNAPRLEQQSQYQQENIHGNAQASCRQEDIHGNAQLAFIHIHGNGAEAPAVLEVDGASVQSSGLDCS